MEFVPTGLPGAFVLEPQPMADERGLFARTFCAREFAEHGLTSKLVQCSVSYNRQKGTLRGLHYQRSPQEEAKLVRCTAGAVYDVIVDLRPGSATYLQHFGVELSASSRRSLFVPEMFAHGFQTLEDDTEVFYQMSQFHAPDHAAGLRYNDPALGIDWPLPVSVMSDKDRTWPLVA
ncbi:MAG TPA: dTDP-4-dehydrorhamnose 3,5-epimerase [Chthoniobacterales bacterium]